MTVAVAAPADPTTTPTLDEPWTPEVAASNGAVFLDEQRPGWADEIDPDSLHMCDSGHCVLAQLYGYYADGADALDLGDAYAFEWESRVCRMGFLVASNGARNYGLLTAAWRTEILNRRNKP